MKKIYVLFMVFPLIFFIGCGKDKDDTTDNVPTPTYEDTVAMDDLSDQPFDVETTDSAVVMTEDTTGNLQPIEPPVRVEENQKIYVIAGSFKNNNNAQKLLKKLNDKGYNPQILPKYGDYYRVAVAGYDTEKEARSALKNFRKEFKNPKIWLLLR